MTTKPTAEVSVEGLVEEFLLSADLKGKHGEQMLKRILHFHTTALKGRVVEMVKEKRKKVNIFSSETGDMFVDDIIKAITNIT